MSADADRCPRCGIHLAGTDVVDKAKAWTAIAEKNAEIERLRAALKPFASGGEWGAILAWLVEGAPTRAQGIERARTIVGWQDAADKAL